MRRLVLIGLAAVLAGCGYLQASPRPDALLASLDTPDGTIGVYRDGSGIHLVLGDQDTGGSDPAGTAPTVHLFSFSGDTSRTYNSFVFGLAPTDSTQVELAGLQAIGGEVTNGVYVLALRQKDVLPTQLNWVFKSQLGEVIAHGSKITPYDREGQRLRW